MPIRHFYQPRFSLLKSVSVPDCSWLNHQEYFHLPGQAAAIRYLDPQSKTDFLTVKQILSHSAVQRWMDDPTLYRWEYQDMADPDSMTNLLFSVHETRGKKPKVNSPIRGFVYLYGNRTETFRLKRLVKFGLVYPPPENTRYLEISFAAKPVRPSQITGSGLMASAVRQACIQARLVYRKTGLDLKILGFVHPENLPAQQTLLAGGFDKIGQVRYDPDSPDQSTVYLLMWRKLQQKITHKLVELQANS